jgi:hypothetical protein
MKWVNKGEAASSIPASGTLVEVVSFPFSYLAHRLVYDSQYFSVLLHSTPSPILGIFCLTCVEVFSQVFVMHTVLLAAHYEEIIFY